MVALIVRGMSAVVEEEVTSSTYSTFFFILQVRLEGSEVILITSNYFC